MTESQKKKLGDLLCDIGKYLITVVPLSYFLSDKDDVIYVVIGTAFFGLLLILFGLYFIKSSENMTVSKTKQKRKIKVLRNTVFVVEEEQQI